VENYGKDGWRHSDEETFRELRGRALEAVEYLEKLKENSVLVIAHGLFLRMLLMVMMSGDELTAGLCMRFRYFVWHDYTGITVCDYDREKGEWHLVTWNDHAHLG
jgi:broad specificity phosphatase PhoE